MRRAIFCVFLIGCWSSSKTTPTSSSTGTGSAAVTATVATTTATTTTTTTTNATLPPTPGCKRVRQTHVYRCSGVPPGPGESNSSPTTACDECLADSDCTAKAGGSCQERGDQMCTGPRRAVCLYPDPACGGRICAERAIDPPPSAAPSR